MEKDSVFRQRKELKRKSHQVVRKHYFVLVFLTLILALFGLEYTSSTMGWGKSSGNFGLSMVGTLADMALDGVISELETEDASESIGPEESEAAAIEVPAAGQSAAQNTAAEDASPTPEAEADARPDPGSVLDDDDVTSMAEVFSSIVQGRLEEGEARSEKLSGKQQSQATRMLGRTNGVLAQFVNTMGSGKLFVMLAQAIRTITRSDHAVSVIFIIGAFLWYALILCCLKTSTRRPCAESIWRRGCMSRCHSWISRILWR